MSLGLIKYFKRLPANLKRNFAFLCYSGFAVYELVYISFQSSCRANRPMVIAQSIPFVRTTIMRAWMHFELCVALLACCCAGCQHTSSIPSDPIFVSKKPIISKPELKPPAFVAYLEPDVPAGPVEAVASQPNANAEVVPVNHTVRGQSGDYK